MHVPPENSKKLNDVVDIIVEVEGARHARDEACVLPFGDIDLVMRKKIADRRAKKRGEMAGHGRDEEDLGVPQAAPARHLPLEMDEIAEGLGDHDPLSYSGLASPHLDAVDAPRRLAVAARGALEEFEHGCCAFAEGRVVGGIERVAEEQTISVCCGPRRAQGRPV
jgi:hypothetical protein